MRYVLCSMYGVLWVYGYGSPLGSITPRMDVIGQLTLRATPAGAISLAVWGFYKHISAMVWWGGWKEQEYKLGISPQAC